MCLVTLPDGATLRSYLASKLNCDPMRVTKKYAGASCLGRRVFQVRERQLPSALDIQLAKAELDMLEQRFKRRVEEGRPGIPLTPQFDLATALTQAQAQQPSLMVPSLTALSPWLASGAPAIGPVVRPALGVLTSQNLRALAQSLAPPRSLSAPPSHAYASPYQTSLLNFGVANPIPGPAASL
jgi:hypothetical protein